MKKDGWAGSSLSNLLLSKFHSRTDYRSFGFFCCFWYFLTLYTQVPSPYLIIGKRFTASTRPSRKEHGKTDPVETENPFPDFTSGEK
nr:MAG TPA: hypothetical protein [Caudoviricetes sp.]